MGYVHYFCAGSGILSEATGFTHNEPFDVHVQPGITVNEAVNELKNDDVGKFYLDEAKIAEVTRLALTLPTQCRKKSAVYRAVGPKLPYPYPGLDFTDWRKRKKVLT